MARLLLCVFYNIQKANTSKLTDSRAWSLGPLAPGSATVIFGVRISFHVSDSYVNQKISFIKEI